MTFRQTVNRALWAAGFVFLRGGWVRREVAPKLQAQIDKAVRDAAAALDEVRREAVRQAAERLALNVEVLDAMSRWEWPATTEGKVKFILAAMEEPK